MFLLDRRTYRGKKPKNANGFVDDRTIVFLSPTQVQYDSPAVPFGQKRPKVPRKKFEDWADHDVSDQLPAGEYQRWEDYEKRRVG